MTWSSSFLPCLLPKQFALFSSLFLYFNYISIYFTGNKCCSKKVAGGAAGRGREENINACVVGNEKKRVDC